MDLPTLISRMSTISILGVLYDIFHFYSNFYSIFCLQTVKTLNKNAASDIDLHYLPMSHKNSFFVESYKVCIIICLWPKNKKTKVNFLLFLQYMYTIKTLNKYALKSL